MRDRFLSKIRREIEHAKAGRPARIIAKMNALQDPKIIATLYEASHAGVQIELIIRGFCSLRPKVPGQSENIRVYSILGRFLEHSRIFWFQNGGNEEYYIGSADWMYRNLDYRVEAVTPIEDPASLRDRLKEILDTRSAGRPRSRVGIGIRWQMDPPIHPRQPPRLRYPRPANGQIPADGQEVPAGSMTVSAPAYITKR